MQLLLQLASVVLAAIILNSALKLSLALPQVSLEQQQQQEQDQQQQQQQATLDATDPASNSTQADQPTSGQYKYAVIIDAGSSGSRGHIFRWPANATKDELPSKVEPMKDATSGKPLKKSIWPGLSSVKNRPEEASDYMKPIMDYISGHIPAEAQKETPVYVMATAGLRLLSRQTQTEILGDIVHDLKAEYGFPNLYTKVISGSNEGLYQWLSVNAYGGRLTQAYNQTGKNFYCTAPRSRKYGMLEMGGASAQVSYELSPELETMIGNFLRPYPDALNAFRNSLVEIHLGPEDSRVVKLFSTTFLGLGSNSARKLAVDLLVRDALKIPGRSASAQFGFLPVFYSPGSTLILLDPCLPPGAQQVMTKPADLLFNQTRTIGYNPVKEDETFKVRLIGTGNFAQCQRLLVRMLESAKKERLNCEPDEKSCSITLMGTNFVPFRFMQFLGLGELYYTTNEMIRAPGRFDYNTVLRRAVQICSTPYETLLKQYPEANRVDSKRVLLECFKATWVLTWLGTGLRMNGADLTTLDTINGNTLDWTLGALIRKLLKYPGGLQTDADLGV